MRGARRRKSKAGVANVALLAAGCLSCLSVFLFFEEPPRPSFVVVESGGERGAVDSNLSDLIPANLTLAVTTLVLNQGRYLAEWVDFHARMGFQFFLIFDDGSTDDTFEVLAPYVRDRTVLVVHARRSFAVCADQARQAMQHQQAQCQTAVFNYARSQLAGKTAWMGNFDVDEFVWTPILPLPRLLARPEFASYDRLDLVGLVFGTNNVSQASGRPVLETFIRRAQVFPYPFQIRFVGPEYAHKSLFRPDKIGFVGVHWPWCFLCRCRTIRPLSHDIRLNHYQYKSRAEQREKAALNRNPALDFSPDLELFLNTVEDVSILHSFSAFPDAAIGHDSPSTAP